MAEALEFLSPDWPMRRRVRAACTTRGGGVSRGAFAGLNMRGSSDDPAAVAENNRRVAAALELPGPPCWLNQVHGTRVESMPMLAPDPQADACLSRKAGVVCAVQAADCLPVLFCDQDETVVAAAHAGWRGLSAGVLEATIAAMAVPPQRLLAWLGPAIGPEAFEVGAEVREAFLDHDLSAALAFRPAVDPGKYFADLFMLARQRLGRAGVEALYGGGISTHADPGRFFSFRRDGATGRMAALIWLAETP